MFAGELRGYWTLSEKAAGGGRIATYGRHEAGSRGNGSWSGVRWLVVIAIVIAVAAVVTLVVLYGGGSDGADGY